MRYHLFAGDNYYPSAGLGDYVESFDSEEAALDRVDIGPFPQFPNTDRFDWWVVAVERDGKLVQVSGTVERND